MAFDAISYFKNRLVQDDLYEIKPIDFDHLLYSKRYLGLPKLSQPQYEFLHVMSDINPITCQYTRAVLEWGKGGGKDWMSAILGLLIAYKLECYHDPYSFYGLPEGVFRGEKAGSY